MSKNTLYIAVLVTGSYEEMADSIDEGVFPENGLMSETSFNKLRERITGDVQSNPTHRWLVLTGTTLAETSAPPVTFREVR